MTLAFSQAWKIILVLLTVFFLLVSCSNGTVEPEPPKPIYNITFNVSGIPLGKSDQAVVSGSRATLPSPEPTNSNPRLVFDGWTNKVYTNGFNFNTPIKNSFTLYAKWADAVIVTFDGLGTTPAPPNQKIKKGTNAVAPDPAPTNSNKRYLFAGWTNATYTTPFVFTNTIVSDTTLYAYLADAVTITYDDLGANTPVPEQTIIKGTNALAPTPPPEKTDYGFQGWTNATYPSPFSFSNVAIVADTTFYASWKPRPETKAALITFVSNAIAIQGNNADLNFIDTSLITDMSELFKDNATFNGDISSWNTSKVTDMSLMFYNATSFNRSLEKWDTSSVADMKFMFSGATAFNGDITTWKTSNVKSMVSMLRSAIAFNQDISSWNTSSLTSMRVMFRGATKFNQDISSWNTAKVTDMAGLFWGATSFNQDIRKWKTSEVTTMRFMFFGATRFNQDIRKWNTAKVTDMQKMFADATIFNQPIGEWDTSSVTDMKNMFLSAIDFNQDLERWQTYLSGRMVEKTDMFKDSGVTRTGGVGTPSWYP